MSLLPESTDIAVGTVDEQIQLLSMEAGLVANVVDSFSKIVPSLQEMISNAFTALATEPNDSILATAKEAEEATIVIGRARDQVRFVDYSEVLVDVPEAFIGNFPKYIALLCEISQNVTAKAIVEIKAYNSLLAQFAGSEDGKITVRDHTDIAKRLDKIRMETIRRLEDYQDPKKDLSKRRLGDVVNNFDDLVEMGRRVRLLSTDYKNFDLKSFAIAVEKTDHYLKLITSEDGLERVSGPQAKNISIGAKAVAEYISFVALFRYKMEQAIVACSKMTKAFEKI